MPKRLPQKKREPGKKRLAKHKKEKATPSQWWYWVLVVLFVGVVGYTVLWAPFARLARIEISGTQSLDEGVVRSALWAELSETWFSVVPRDAFVLVLPRNIEAFLRQSFPRIETVQVVRTFPHTLTVTIAEREAAMLWCRSEDQNSCLVLDHQGVAHTVDAFGADYVQEHVPVRIIDESGTEHALETQIIPPEEVELMRQLRSLVQDASGVEIQETFRVPSRVAEEVTVQTQEGWRMFLSIPRAREDIVTVKLFFDRVIFDQPRETLEYIDFRIKGKVFYKFPQEEEEEEDGEGSDEDGDEGENESREDAASSDGEESAEEATTAQE